MSRPREEPAFPQRSLVEDRRCQGMSLRDWFAGMALQGILANPSAVHTDKNWRHGAEKMAYQLAKAMLKQREER